MNKNERIRAYGFTLVELVVVLLVLAALAGILLPQFTGVVNRTHTAASSTNIGELAKAFSLYNVKTLKGYPDQYEPMVTASGVAPTAAANNNLSTLPFDVSSANTDIIVQPLTADQLTSLQNNGIKNIYPMRATIAATQSATFDSVDSSVLQTPIDTTQKFIFLSPLKAKAAFGIGGIQLGEVYICLGVGAQCTAIGTVMQGSAAALRSDRSGDHVRTFRGCVRPAGDGRRAVLTRASSVSWGRN